MLGHKSPQMSFADVDRWWESIPHNSIWQCIRTWSDTSLRDEDFAHWYSNLGRHSVPPSFIIGLTVIQLRQGWSDQEAVDAAQFDDRVKYALGLSRSPEVHCDRSTLCKYRRRLLDEGLDRGLLRHSLELAAASGLLSNETDIVDSFMVAGAAARQGTLTLIRSATQQVLRQARRDGLPIPELRRADYDQAKRPAINWNNPDARANLLQELVEDADTCQNFYSNDQYHGYESLSHYLKLLKLVATQDVTRDESGRISITQGTAPDRIISTVDTEMRHGRKTSSAKFDGYKAHLAVQNVAPSEGARLITAVEVTGGNVADGSAAAALLQEREGLTGSMPHEVMGDTAYGSSGVEAKIKEVAPDIRITAPVPPSNNRHDLFPKTAFTIDTENHTITCPAEETISYHPKRPLPNHKATQVVKLDLGACATCPLREQCVKGKGPRTITIRSDEAQIQKRRAEQESEAWKGHYRERPRVEHVNAEMARHGARQGRYFGVRKILFQERICALAYNLKEICRVAGTGWPPGVHLRPQSA